jgi:hypothetical protein
VDGISMNEQNRVTVVDLTLPVIEFNSERVLTLASIDNLHRVPINTTHNIFSQNQSKLQMNKHYYIATVNDQAFVATYHNILPPSGLILITQRGYSMLVKAFTDDFSWQVQEQLADAYFDAQRLLTPAEQLLNQANVLVQHDKRMSMLEETQRTTLSYVHEAKIDARKANLRADEAFTAATAALSHKFGDKDFYTIMAFCRMKNIKTDLSLAKVRGMQASNYTKSINGQINRIPDERFGEVNSYHISVLEHIFSDILLKK